MPADRGRYHCVVELDVESEDRKVRRELAAVEIEALIEGRILDAARRKVTYADGSGRLLSMGADAAVNKMDSLVTVETPMLASVCLSAASIKNISLLCSMILSLDSLCKDLMLETVGIDRA